jgi:hypothetical protein
VFFAGSGNAANHLSVAPCSLWLTATQSTSLCAAAISLIFKNVFSAKGQPQCLRKLIMVGLPSFAGMFSFGVGGAFWPTVGVSAVDTLGGDSHELSSVCQVMVD